MLAGREAAHICDDFNFIARLREGDGAFHLIALGRVENRNGFGRLRGKGRRADQSENGGHDETENRAGECVCFHPPLYTGAADLEEIANLLASNAASNVVRGIRPHAFSPPRD